MFPAANKRLQITLQHVLKLYPMEAAGTVQDGNDLVSEHYDELVPGICGCLSVYPAWALMQVALPGQ